MGMSDEGVATLVKRLLPDSAWRGARWFRSTRVGRSLFRVLKGQPQVGSLRDSEILTRAKPFSDHYGSDRGAPIDRRFIETFLEGNADDIKGAVLEVQDSQYTTRYGGAKVSSVLVIGASPGEHITLVTNLETCEGIASESIDCVLVTQTLQFVFDLPAAMRSMHRILRPGGVLLITVPGIQPLGPDAWPHYWSFTPHSVRKLAELTFPSKSIQVESFGNVSSASAFLLGLSLQDIREDILTISDKRFPVIVGLRAVKEPSGEGERTG